MEKVIFNSPRWFDITDLEGEIWKEISDTKGYYSISNYGRIRRNQRTFHLNDGILRRLKTRIMKLEKTRQGYLHRRVQIDGGKKLLRPQRLVALYFLENPNNWPCVNHIDEDKTNNHVENLEFCTYSYNTLYGEGYKNRVQKLKETKAKTRHIIIQYSLDGEKIRTFNGYKEVSDAGYSGIAVLNCCEHRSQQSGGYVWRFKDDPFVKPLPRKRGYKLHGKCCKVNQYDTNMNLIATYDTISNAKKALNISGSNISSCCKGKVEQAYGYIWKYANTE